MVGARCLLAELDEFLILDDTIRVLVGRHGGEEKKIRRGRHAEMIPILGDGLITKRIGTRFDCLAPVVTGIRTVYDHTYKRAGRESGIRGSAAPALLGQYLPQPDFAKGARVTHN